MNLFLFIVVALSATRYSTAEEPQLQSDYAVVTDPAPIEVKNAITIISPTILLNNVTTDAPSSSPPADETIRTGSARSRMIISYTMLAVAALVIHWSLWVFRKELLDGCKKACGRHSSDGEEGALNDIIFDPDEEQSDTLSQSLLTDSA